MASSFPLIGTAKLKGLTVAQAEKEMEGLLQKDYLVNPQVTIFVEEYYRPDWDFIRQFKRETLTAQLGKILDRVSSN